MRRIKVTLQSKNNPNLVVLGQALAQDLEGQLVSFFTAQKLPLDEEFTLTYSFENELKTLNVKLLNLNEQVSSGRVMNSVPGNEQPFPVQKFYRCYTRNLDFVPAIQDAPVEEPKAA